MVKTLSTAVLGTMLMGSLFFSVTVLFSEPVTEHEVAVSEEQRRRRPAVHAGDRTVDPLRVERPSGERLALHAFRLKHIQVTSVST